MIARTFSIELQAKAAGEAWCMECAILRQGSANGEMET